MKNLATFFGRNGQLNVSISDWRDNDFSKKF